MTIISKTTHSRVSNKIISNYYTKFIKKNVVENCILSYSMMKINKTDEQTTIFFPVYFNAR